MMGTPRVRSSARSFGKFHARGARQHPVQQDQVGRGVFTSVMAFSAEAARSTWWPAWVRLKAISSWMVARLRPAEYWRAWRVSVVAFEEIMARIETCCYGNMTSPAFADFILVIAASSAPRTHWPSLPFAGAAMLPDTRWKPCGWPSACSVGLVCRAFHLAMVGQRTAGAQRGAGGVLAFIAGWRRHSHRVCGVPAGCGVCPGPGLRAGGVCAQFAADPPPGVL